MRVTQPRGTRGSLRSLQSAVANPAILDAAIRRTLDLDGAATIHWRSPLQDDDWAEYRDASFLDRLDLEHLTGALREFWPSRGPQWDALATVSTGEILLVEAKSHVNEMISTCQAGERSLKQIRSALVEARRHFGAAPHAEWTQPYYQLANRLAHLAFLRRNDVAAHLVLVCFMNDDMRGPATAEEWQDALVAARLALGLGRGGIPGVHEVFVDARALAQPSD